MTLHHRAPGRRRACTASRFPGILLGTSHFSTSPQLADFVAPGPGDNFEFGIKYTACGSCKFAARYGDKEILHTFVGLISKSPASMSVLGPQPYPEVGTA
jgi:hypothetical protein